MHGLVCTSDNAGALAGIEIEKNQREKLRFYPFTIGLDTDIPT